MKKKIFLAFGLGTLLGAATMYLHKEKQLEEMRKLLDDEEDYEEDEDFFEEDLDEDSDVEYVNNKTFDDIEAEKANESEKEEAKD